MPLRIRPGQANTTCDDCEHYVVREYGVDGTCSEASEALVLEGWPRGVVHIEAHMSAETCPSFYPNGRGKESVQPWEE